MGRPVHRPGDRRGHQRHDIDAVIAEFEKDIHEHGSDEA